VLNDKFGIPGRSFMLMPRRGDVQKKYQSMEKHRHEYSDCCDDACSLIDEIRVTCSYLEAKDHGMSDGRSIESMRLAVKTGRTFEVLDDDAIRFPFSHAHIASRPVGQYHGSSQRLWCDLL
jgi:hypothetical protein